MSRRHAAVATALVVLTGAWVGAQTLEPGNVMATGTPMALMGPVTMAQGLTVDGGVRATDVYASNVTTSELTVNGNAYLGPSTTLYGPSNFTGAVNLANAQVSGLTKSGTLARAAALTLGVGCATLGTVTITGAGVDDLCQVVNVPASIANVVVTCDVKAPDVATLSACGFIALIAAPAGNYDVRTLSGR